MTHPLEPFATPPGWKPENDAPPPDEGAFAHSHDPALDTGVDYSGPYETPYDGIGEAVRRHASALDGAGIPVFLTTSGGLRGRRYQDLEPHVRKRIDPLTICRYKAPLLRVFHAILGRSTIHRAVFPRSQIELKPGELRRLQQTTIVMTVHERLAPDPELRDLAKLLNLVAEVWVPCSRNRRVLIDSGVAQDRIHVVPHPYDPDDLPLFDQGLRQAKQLDSPGRPFQFFNCGKWEPRKGQHELIGAFLQAFSPVNNVRLALKTSAFGKWKEYSEGPVQSVLYWLERDVVKARGWTYQNAQRAFTFIIDSVPRETLVAMHCQSDCYVSASRAEGFDLPAFDAKLAGKRMVYVRSGGPEDFSTSGDIAVESTPLDAVNPQYNWEGAKWSGHTVEALRDALLQAVLQRGVSTERTIPSKYSPESVGALMRSRVEAVLSRLGEEPADAKR